MEPLNCAKAGEFEFAGLHLASESPPKTVRPKTRSRARAEYLVALVDGPVATACAERAPVRE